MKIKKWNVTKMKFYLEVEEKKKIDDKNTENHETAMDILSLR